MTGDIPISGQMFCRKCGYQLAGLSENRCPECGRPFDPSNRRTFLRGSRSWHVRRRARWIILLCLLLPPGLGLGLVYTQWRIEQWAIGGITSLGGTVNLNRTGPASLQRVLGNRLGFLLDRVVSIRLRGSGVTDAALLHVQRLHQTESLDLENAAVTDHGLLALRDLHELRRIDLTGTWITDAGLGTLSGHPLLRNLYLGRTWVSDAGLVHLAGLSNLEVLDLHQTAISGTGLACLQNPVRLRCLYLSGSPITDEGLAKLPPLLSMGRLDLAQTHITDAVLAHVQGFTGLQILDIRSPGVTGTGLKYLSALPLKALSLSVSSLAAEGITCLQGLSNLQALTLDNWTRTDGLMQAAGVPGVNSMQLGPGSRFIQGDAEAECFTTQGSAFQMQAKRGLMPQAVRNLKIPLVSATMPAAWRPGLLLPE